MSKEQSSKVEQEPVAYWIPKADQFCKADTTGRPFAKSWEPLYDKPFNTEELQKENKSLLMANLDVSDWFNALKVDYDELTKERDELEDKITELTSEEHSIPELRNQLQEEYEEKRKCYFAVSQYAKTIKNLIKENNGLKDSLELALAALSMAKTYVAGSCRQMNGSDDEVDQVCDAIEALKKVLKD